MRGAHDDIAPPTVPGLLPWQYPFISLILGLLALRFAWPALAGLLLFTALAGPWTASGRRLALLAGCFVAGWAWAWLAVPLAPAEPAAWMAERRVAEVTGRVAQVESGPGRQLKVFLNEARYALDDGTQGALPGLFLWTWQDPGVWPHPGQTARLRTRVRPVRGFANPGAWDTRFHWLRQGVFYRGFTKGGKGAPEFGDEPPGAGARLRAAMRGALEAAAPDTAGRSLVAALVLGERYFVDREVYDTVRRSTLAHSLALSGMHLGFVAGLGAGLAWLAGWLWPRALLRLPRPKLGVLLAAPLVVLYIWLGGGTPSLLRAGIMFGAWGGLLLLDRDRVLLDGLFLAVALILLADPLAVYDVRLQFSALAVAGIAVLTPMVWPLVPWREVARGSGPSAWAARTVRGLAGVLLVSLAANVALLPVMLWNFGETGLSLYLNVVWLPLLGFFAVPVGFVGVLLAVAPGLENVGRALLFWDAEVLDRAISLLMDMDVRGWMPVVTPLRPLWPHLVGYYGLLAGLLVLGRTRARLALGGCLAAALLLVWPAIWAGVSGQNERLALTVLDAGQSQSVLLDLPGGGRVLVDGGGGWKGGIDPGAAVVLPALSRGRWPGLDMMVLTHPDFDHYGGLPYVLEHAEVGEFVHGGRWPKGGDGETLRELLEEGDVPVRTVRSGCALLLSREVALEVLHPEDQNSPGSNNDESLVLRLVWRGRGMALLPGDVEQAGLRSLLRGGDDLSADVLMLPHHGSAGSLSPELYARAKPDMALAATGYINYLGFPSPQVREALAECGIPLFDTGGCGALRVVWDGPDAAARLETALGCGGTPAIP